MADVKKHGYHGLVFGYTTSYTHYLLLVAEQFDISRSDCTRAGGTSVVTCESDNGVLEAGGRGKARDAETGND
jgi:hypothetical protein